MNKLLAFALTVYASCVTITFLLVPFYSPEFETYGAGYGYYLGIFMALVLFLVWLTVYFEWKEET